MLPLALILLLVGMAPAQENFLEPFTNDEHTMLLMHFEGDLANEADLTEDGTGFGKINFFANSISALGQALYLNNDSEGDTTHVVIPGAEALNPKGGDYTFEGWTNALRFQGFEPYWKKNPPIFGKPGQDPGLYSLMMHGLYHRLEFYSEFSGIDNIETGDNTVNLGEWVHFVVMLDSTNGSVGMLVHNASGELVTWDTGDYFPLEWPMDDLTDLVIAPMSRYNNFHYDGLVDELRFSNVLRDYVMPPRISGVHSEPGGRLAGNAAIGEPVKILASIRPVGNAAIASATVHYNDGTGWQSMAMASVPDTSLYEVDLPAINTVGAQVSYYIEAETDQGFVATAPKDAVAAQNYYAYGVWDNDMQTLDLTFEEGPSGTPTDNSDFGHPVEIRGDNWEYSTEVSPSATGSQYSIAINTIDDMPETTYIEIPAPAPFLNQTRDGWTLEYWYMVDTLYAGGDASFQYTATIPGVYNERIDQRKDHLNLQFRTEGWYHYLYNYDIVHKWLHYRVGRTDKYAFITIKDQTAGKDSILYEGTAAIDLPPDDPGLPPDERYVVPFDAGPATFAAGDAPNRRFKGLYDNIKFWNYPYMVPPAIIGLSGGLGGQTANATTTITAGLETPGASVADAKIHYTTGSAWNSVDMTQVDGTLYSGDVPGLPKFTLVDYYIKVEDSNGNFVTLPANAEKDSVYLTYGTWEPESQTLDLDFEEGPDNVPADASEYQNQITVHGAPEYSDIAMVGDYSLSLEGDSSGLTIENPVFVTGSEFTIDLWARPEDSGGGWLMAKNASTWHKGNYFLTFRSTDAGLQVEAATTMETGERVSYRMANAIPHNAWYHIVFEVSEVVDTLALRVYDADNNLLEEGGRTLPADLGLSLEAGQLVIGGGSGPGGFPGKIDGLQFHNYAFTQTGVTDELGIPLRIGLSQNYPNPFNPTTEIQYTIPMAQDVSLTVYDILGRKVKSLVDQKVKPGVYTVTWDGTNTAGHTVASGVYFYRLDAKDVTKVKKMVLIR